MSLLSYVFSQARHVCFADWIVYMASVDEYIDSVLECILT